MAATHTNMKIILRTVCYWLFPDEVNHFSNWPPHSTERLTVLQSKSAHGPVICVETNGYLIRQS